MSRKIWYLVEAKAGESIWRRLYCREKLYREERTDEDIAKAAVEKGLDVTFHEWHTLPRSVTKRIEDAMMREIDPETLGLSRYRICFDVKLRMVERT